LNAFQKLALHAALLAALLGVGCVQYQAKPMLLTAIATAQQSRSMASSCIKAIQRSNALRWREAELIAAAECFNPALARAKAATQLAAASGELAQRYPGLALVLSAEYARSAPESSKWLRGLSVDLPLDFGARRAVRLQTAVQTQLLIALEDAIAHRAVAADIGLSIDAICAAQQEAALLRLRAEQQQAWLNFTLQRIAEGQSALPEILKPQQDLLATQAAKLRTQAAERTARSQLALALGLPLSQVLALNVQAKAAKVAPLTDARQRQAALLARPELLRALGQYQLSELALRLEVARQYPDIRLIPGYIWERGLVKLPLSLSAALPPQGGNRAAILVAGAARELAARELELVQANITTEIDLALANHEAAKQAYALGVQQLESVKMEARAAGAAFDAGMLDQLGRLGAALHLSDMQLSVHTLAVELQRAERALAIALALPADLARPPRSMEPN
jgi:outer membrane protein TolC